jgi:hypothetical protein
MSDETVAAQFLGEVHTREALRNYFAVTLMNPTFHWFFVQGLQALEQELYIPGVSALLNGIEASIRVTVAQLAEGYDGNLSLSPFQLLSNTLLKRAGELGMPIDALAWPGEADFQAKLDTKANVALVQLRHDVCHGNLLRFIHVMEYEKLEILTPESLRSTAAELLGISLAWARRLAVFRNENGRRPKDIPIPPEPPNPLAQWLPPAREAGRSPSS